MKQSTLLYITLGVYAVIFGILEAVISNVASPWLNSLVGWPPKTEMLDGNLVWIYPVATRPLWVRGVIVTTVGIVSLPLTLIALRLMIGGNKDD